MASGQWSVASNYPYRSDYLLATDNWQLPTDDCLMITDCHIHIQPIEMFKPQALELMKKQRANFDQIAEFCRSPKAFLQYLDAAGVERAVLINYVAPEVIGFTSGVNKFVADYTK